MANEEKEKGGEGEVAGHLSHANIYRALSWFQGELTPIEQKSEVSFNTRDGKTVQFKYANLGAIMEVIYPLLAKHGLSVRHELGDGWVQCILTHETYSFKEEGGENILYSGKLPIEKKTDMKEVGAQITYARRYTLSLVLGIATEEDTDVQLMEQAQKNTADFAFKQATSVIEKAEGNDLTKQIEFLEKELKLAQELEAGTGKRAPSLGLKASQYNDLFNIAKARVRIVKERVEMEEEKKPTGQEVKNFVNGAGHYSKVVEGVEGIDPLFPEREVDEIS